MARGRPRKELVEVAEKLNIKQSPNETEESLAYKVGQQSEARVNDAMKHVAERPAQTVEHSNTPEGVLAAVQHLIDGKGLTATFMDNDTTVIFKCGGVEESVNLSIPLRVIKQKAENVSRGTRRLMSMGRDNTYKGYADTILMG